MQDSGMEYPGKSIFEQQGYLKVKDVVSPELCKFLTHILLRKSETTTVPEDPQVPDCLTTMDHELVFETLLERVWPILENCIGIELLPTYAYARLYKNGNVLETHTDRPACEISITVQLARSHHYSWPLYVNGSRFDLAEGDAVIYKGCDYFHWRDACDGPPDYYSVQVFLHYVNANGKYSNEYCDSSNRDVNNRLFVKYRNFLMEDK